MTSGEIDRDMEVNVSEEVRGVQGVIKKRGKELDKSHNDKNKGREYSTLCMKK